VKASAESSASPDTAGWIGRHPSRLALRFRSFWSAGKRELVRTAAMDAGFADTAHLSRVFSSMSGLSPSVAIAGLDEAERE
jgi:AraC-like DNA-binding protein